VVPNDNLIVLPMVAAAKTGGSWTRASLSFETSVQVASPRPRRFDIHLSDATVGADHVTPQRVHVGVRLPVQIARATCVVTSAFNNPLRPAHRFHHRLRRGARVLRGRMLLPRCERRVLPPWSGGAL